MYITKMSNLLQTTLKYLALSVQLKVSIVAKWQDEDAADDEIGY